ncbi:MAG: hypothetical protein FWE25_09750 [Lachnospiraceae bacterium]|nr:hypothetical protein [Lachnospiraceae bacterium]
MKSESVIAREYRLKEWAQQIKKCQSRPHNVTVVKWCEEMGINEATYYYRLRAVRNAVLTSSSKQDIVAIPLLPLEQY